MKSRKNKNKKENKKIFEKAYLADPEYRAFLVKIFYKEDKDMENITNQLAKLFQD